MVREYRGPIRCLNQAWQAKRHVWVVCLQCGHAAKRDPRDLLLKVGSKHGDLPFEELQRQSRFRCRNCGFRLVGFLPHYAPWSAMR